MSKFNAENKGYKDGYPLFLGDDLGIIDTINTQYPKLEELYQDQAGQIWNEFEVDLTQDKMDMLELNKGTVDLMVKNLMWQTVADSVASRSIIELFGVYASNSELKNLLSIWNFFETIHARTYSHIIKQTLVDPNSLLEDIYTDKEVLKRSATIVEAFDKLDEGGCELEGSEEEDIILALTALLGLESIAFMASFAVTFAIVETGKFQGIGKLVQLVCRDEVLHSRMGYEILSILKDDPKWQPYFKKSEEKIKNLLDTIVEREVISASYVFSEGRDVIGCNPELLESYILYMAKPVYDLFEINLPNAPKDNPLPYMDKYIDSSKLQNANMEIQNSSYLIGAIDDDTFGLDLANL